MSEPINLLERYGETYKVTYDPAYDPHNIPRDKRDPWMMTLVGERGIIYPVGGDLLAVEIDGRPVTAKKVAALPGVKLTQDGDLLQEKTYVFPSCMFDQVAALVKPRKRRKAHPLTPEQKQALIVAGAAYRFGPATGTQGNGAALQATQSPQGGLDPTEAEDIEV